MLFKIFTLIASGLPLSVVSLPQTIPASEASERCLKCNVPHDPVEPPLESVPALPEEWTRVSQRHTKIQLFPLKVLRPHGPSLGVNQPTNQRNGREHSMQAVALHKLIKGRIEEGRDLREITPGEFAKALSKVKKETEKRERVFFPEEIPDETYKLYRMDEDQVFADFVRTVQLLPIFTRVLVVIPPKNLPTVFALFDSHTVWGTSCPREMKPHFAHLLEKMPHDHLSLPILPKASAWDPLRNLLKDSCYPELFFTATRKNQPNMVKLHQQNTNSLLFGCIEALIKSEHGLSEQELTLAQHYVSYTIMKLRIRTLDIPQIDVNQYERYMNDGFLSLISVLGEIKVCLSLAAAIEPLPRKNTLVLANELLQLVEKGIILRNLVDNHIAFVNDQGPRITFETDEWAEVYFDPAEDHTFKKEIQKVMHEIDTKMYTVKDLEKAKEKLQRQADPKVVNGRTAKNANRAQQRKKDQTAKTKNRGEDQDTMTMPAQSDGLSGIQMGNPADLHDDEDDEPTELALTPTEGLDGQIPKAIEIVRAISHPSFKAQTEQFFDCDDLVTPAGMVQNSLPLLRRRSTNFEEVDEDAEPNLEFVDPEFEPDATNGEDEFFEVSEPYNADSGSDDADEFFDPQASDKPKSADIDIKDANAGEFHEHRAGVSEALTRRSSEENADFNSIEADQVEADIDRVQPTQNHARSDSDTTSDYISIITPNSVSGISSCTVNDVVTAPYKEGLSTPQANVQQATPSDPQDEDFTLVVHRKNKRRRGPTAESVVSAPVKPKSDKKSEPPVPTPAHRISLEAPPIQYKKHVTNPWNTIDKYPVQASEVEFPPLGIKTDHKHSTHSIDQWVSTLSDNDSNPISDCEEDPSSRSDTLVDPTVSSDVKLVSPRDAVVDRLLSLERSKAPRHRYSASENPPNRVYPVEPQLNDFAHAHIPMQHTPKLPVTEFYQGTTGSESSRTAYDTYDPTVYDSSELDPPLENHWNQSGEDAYVPGPIMSGVVMPLPINPPTMGRKGMRIFRIGYGSKDTAPMYPPIYPIYPQTDSHSDYDA